MIVIAGKNNIAVRALECFFSNYKDHEIVAIINNNDIGVDGWQRSFKKRASELDIEVKRIEDINVNSKDIFLSLEFDKIIKENIYEKCQAYNIHFSDLPKYKGMYTSIWPIINGDNKGATTLHKIDSGIDTGDIYNKKYFDILEKDRSQDLYRKYIKSSIELFDESIESILNGCLVGHEQEKEFSSYFSMSSIDFNKNNIKFNDTAWSIKRKVYAFSFRVYQLPIAFGKNIVEVHILDEKSKYKPGKVLRETYDYIDVSTIDFNVRLFFDKLEENLHKFCFAPKVSINYLLNGICGVNDRDINGWSPIIVAAYNGNIEMVEALLNKNADVNDVNYKGTSVLMYAKDYCSKTKDKELFDFLLKQGAKIDHKDYRGKSLIDYLSLEEINFFNI